MSADIFKIVEPYTMVCEEGVRFAVEMARHVERYDITGSIVECGVWKGGCSLAMLLAQREKFLDMFDSFRGMPDAKPIDGERALAWQADTASPAYYDNCRTNDRDVRELFSRHGFTEYEDFSLHRGMFEDTLPQYVRYGSPISLLRIDVDWHEATSYCLKTLVPRVSHGGIVIIDDYHAWDGCRLAVDDFLHAEELPLAELPGKCGAYQIAGDASLDDFSPDQPRDKHGRWTKAGS